MKWLLQKGGGQTPISSICQLGSNWKIVYSALIMAAFIIYKHRDNILRLRQGEENHLF